MSTIEGPKRARRFTASLPVSLSEGAAHYALDTENVSDTGLCLRPAKVFPVGTQLHLVFGRPPELPALSAQGIVRWSEGGKGVGVQLTSFRPGDHQALLRFVDSQSQREEAQVVAPPHIKSQVS
jgi:hypothetical protein